MAFKKYAYYLKGSKIALVEQSEVTSSGTLAIPHCTLTGYNNQVDCEAAGGQWIPGSRGRLSDGSEYVSPITSVADGLEIEYAYSPRYRADADSSFEVNTFYINGWTTTGSEGHLTFLRSHSASVPNWDASPYSAIGDEEFIVVRGSNRWNGLHKIKAGGTDGTLQTYTRVNKSIPFIAGASDIDIAAESSDKALISTNNSSNKWLNAVFSAGDYIFISGSAQAKNNGFWKVDSVAADAATESASGIYIVNRYFCYDAANTLSTEGEDTTVDTTATSNESVNIYKAYRDFCYIQGDINTINDESDEIDLPEYLAKALIYYVKAKLAEDAGDAGARDVLMKEFYAIIEKHESSKIWGARMISPGPNALR